MIYIYKYIKGCAYHTRGKVKVSYKVTHIAYFFSFQDKTMLLNFLLNSVNVYWMLKRLQVLAAVTYTMIYTTILLYILPSKFKKLNMLYTLFCLLTITEYLHTVQDGYWSAAYKQYAPAITPLREDLSKFAKTSISNNFRKMPTVYSLSSQSYSYVVFHQEEALSSTQVLFTEQDGSLANFTC